jgi:hypothetical protein
MEAKKGRKVIRYQFVKRNRGETEVKVGKNPFRSLGTHGTFTPESVVWQKDFQTVEELLLDPSISNEERNRLRILANSCGRTLSEIDMILNQVGYRTCSHLLTKSNRDKSAHSKWFESAITGIGHDTSSNPDLGCVIELKMWGVEKIKSASQYAFAKLPQYKVKEVGRITFANPKQMSMGEVFEGSANHKKGRMIVGLVTQQDDGAQGNRTLVGVGVLDINEIPKEVLVGMEEDYQFAQYMADNQIRFGSKQTIVLPEGYTWEGKRSYTWKVQQTYSNGTQAHQGYSLYLTKASIAAFWRPLDKVNWDNTALSVLVS